MLTKILLLLFPKGDATDHLIATLISKKGSHLNFSIKIEGTKRRWTTYQFQKIEYHWKSGACNVENVKVRLSVWNMLIGRQPIRMFETGVVSFTGFEQTLPGERAVSVENSPTPFQSVNKIWNILQKNICWVPCICRVQHIDLINLPVKIGECASVEFTLKLKKRKNENWYFYSAFESIIGDGHSRSSSLRFRSNGQLTENGLTLSGDSANISLNGIEWKTSIELNLETYEVVWGFSRDGNFTDYGKIFSLHSVLFNDLNLRCRITGLYALSYNFLQNTAKVAGSFTGGSDIYFDASVANTLRAYIESFASEAGDIPALFIALLLQAEDPNFHAHNGIDPAFIGLALTENIRARRIVRGGSTITMQLARTLFLSQDRSIQRKFEEMLLAWQIENVLNVPKDTILSAYLASIDFAPNIKGLKAASYFYFDKHPSVLSCQEMMVLIYAIPRPLYFADAVRNNTIQVRENLRRHLLRSAKIAARRGLITEEAHTNITYPVNFRGLGIALHVNDNPKQS